ncbi:hypothetical protein KY285_026789 [Solanum tuberosum]|nr:hypothetical protein KY285_026789 [Solanum tuberosum]
MLSQMEVIHEHMKGTYGVFRVEEGSPSGYLRPGENQGWNSKRIEWGSSSSHLRLRENQGWNSTRYEEDFHPCYQQRGINQGGNHYRSEEARRYSHDWVEQDNHREDCTQLSESSRSKRSASSPWVNDLLSSILDKVEGSDDLLIGMRDDFSSLNNKVNSHADSIKTLEGQLSLLSAKLTSRTLMEDNERGVDVVTHSGKMTKGNVMEDEDPRM